MRDFYFRKDMWVVMEKLSSDRIEQILDNARASLAIEGMDVTELETEVLRRYALGVYSEKEVLKIIKTKK